MTKVYVVVGDSGLNGSWAEAVFRHPPTQEQLDNLEWGANNTWPRNPVDRRMRPTGWAGYEVYALDIIENEETPT